MCGFHKGSGAIPLEAGYTTATVLRTATKSRRIYLLREASIYDLLAVKLSLEEFAKLVLDVF